MRGAAYTRMGKHPAWQTPWAGKPSISIHTPADQLKEGSASEPLDQYGEVWRFISSHSQCINELLYMTFAPQYQLDSATDHIREWGPLSFACI
jgi:hypothetical protein